MANMDTHAIIEDFITSGIPKKQAEMIVAKVITIAKNEIDSLRTEQLNLAAKPDLEKIRLEIRGSTIDILNWTVPVFFAVLLGNIGVIGTLLLKSIN